MVYQQPLLIWEAVKLGIPTRRTSYFDRSLHQMDQPKLIFPDEVPDAPEDCNPFHSVASTLTNILQVVVLN